MTEIFNKIPKIKYEGMESNNPLSFKFYDADKIVFGKKMSEHIYHLPWHGGIIFVQKVEICLVKEQLINHLEQN